MKAKVTDISIFFVGPSEKMKGYSCIQRARAAARRGGLGFLLGAEDVHRVRTVPDYDPSCGLSL
jgi:hypothetical protein